MGPTTTQICNMALSHLGIAAAIQQLDTDQSQEATACRIFYDPCRQATLRDFPWPFATNTIPLPLISTNIPTQNNLALPPIATTPPLPPAWAYTYGMPQDCLHFLKIPSFFRMNDTRQSRVSYEISYGKSTSTIMTNQQAAYGQYTVDVTDTSRFTPDFALALSLRMASYMAPRLTKGDPFKLGAQSAQRYDVEISRAKATAVNEEQEFQDPQSELIRARGGNAYDIDEIIS